MPTIHTFHPRTTAERAECADFVRRVLARPDRPKAMVPRIHAEVVPAMDVFAAARAANYRTATGAILAGRASRASSAATRVVIGAWMRSLDDLNVQGWAESHLRALFGNRPLSRLFAIGVHARLEVLTDLVGKVADDATLHGEAGKLDAVRTAVSAFDTALNAYDAALEARKVTVDALVAASAAFDLEYDNFADRLVHNEIFDRLVPQFTRTRAAKVVDPELDLEPADPEADAADALTEAPADGPVAEDPDPTA